jgi:hypothetical protein
VAVGMVFSAKVFSTTASSAGQEIAEEATDQSSRSQKQSGPRSKPTSEGQSSRHDPFGPVQ